MIENLTHNTSRRTFMKAASAWSMAALGAIGLAYVGNAGANGRSSGAVRPVPTDGVARGVVFLDANGTGKAAGQTGLPGVLVCNGSQIVKTDQEGRYELPVEGDTILYVIKPRNFMTAIDDLNLPRFYYIHRPNGSPDEDFLYKGVAPTGPLDDAIDFPLYENPEPDDFEILLTADPQPYNLQHLHWYAEETTREFKNLDVAFGLALGDLVGDHLSLMEPYNQINARTGFPWYNVVGNHDFNFMAKEDRFSTETFNRVFGPSTYAFQRGPVHFIVVNNVFWEGFIRMRADGWPRRGQYRGHLRSWQLDFVRNYLKHVPTEERIVVCAHIPMENRSDGHSKHSTPEFPDLLKILSSHPHTMSFSGHTHINMNFLIGEEGGYEAPGGDFHHHFNLSSTCGSWYRGPLDKAGVPFAPGRDGSPKGYAVVRFEGGSKYNIRFKALGMAEDYQMSIAVPEVVARENLSLTQVQVNVFNATEKTQVRMRLNGKEWIGLNQKTTEDPAYKTLQARSEKHPDAGEGALPNPVSTNHHWLASLPADLNPGWHELQVESTNLFVETWTDRRTFAVVDGTTDLDHLNEGTRTPR